ncbi:tetratricopeptide repeat protein [Micromonospora sp. GCM10011542]|uniref:fibronectin type III domain-containing protein n=1 Tax=Micromonospora sp. GCM10011542 TaxID=3317337 RepID=UPI0036209B46
MPHPSPLAAVQHRALALRTAGDLTAARQLLTEAVGSARPPYGADHPEVLHTAHLLARLHREADDPLAARRVLEEAFTAGERRWEHANPVMLAIAFELAEVAEELGNRHEARRNYTRVATTGPAALGAQHPAVRAARRYLGYAASGADGPEAQHGTPSGRDTRTAGSGPRDAAPAVQSALSGPTLSLSTLAAMRPSSDGSPPAASPWAPQAPAAPVPPPPEVRPPAAPPPPAVDASTAPGLSPGARTAQAQSVPPAAPVARPLPGPPVPPRRRSGGQPADLTRPPAGPAGPPRQRTDAEPGGPFQSAADAPPVPPAPQRAPAPQTSAPRWDDPTIQVQQIEPLLAEEAARSRASTAGRTGPATPGGPSVTDTASGPAHPVGGPPQPVSAPPGPVHPVSAPPGYPGSVPVRPGHPEPVSGPPSHLQPVSGPPGYQQPISAPPGHTQPVSGPPGYGPPVSGPPVVPPPVSAPPGHSWYPVSGPPGTFPPVSGPPGPPLPVSAPPVIPPPISAPPVPPWGLTAPPWSRTAPPRPLPVADQAAGDEPASPPQVGPRPDRNAGLDVVDATPAPLPAVGGQGSGPVPPGPAGRLPLGAQPDVGSAQPDQATTTFPPVREPAADPARANHAGPVPGPRQPADNAAPAPVEPAVPPTWRPGADPAPAGPPRADAYPASTGEGKVGRQPNGPAGSDPYGPGVGVPVVYPPVAAMPAAPDPYPGRQSYQPYPAQVYPGQEAHPQASAPPYGEAAESRSAGRNRAAVLGAVAAAGVAVVAVAGLGVVVLNRDDSPPPAPASTLAVPSAPVTAAGPPPGDLRLRDDAATITLTWTDPTGGAVPFMVAGGRAGQALGVIATVDPGRTSHTVNGLNSRVDYCFTVLAVYSTDSFATSGQVCTERERATPPS